VHTFLVVVIGVVENYLVHGKQPFWNQKAMNNYIAEEIV
jgi:hypothetical protein